MHMLIVVAALAFVALTPYVQAQPRVGDVPQITELEGVGDANEDAPRES